MFFLRAPNNCLPLLAGQLNNKTRPGLMNHGTQGRRPEDFYLKWMSMERLHYTE